MTRHKAIVAGDWTADADGKVIGYEAEIEDRRWNGFADPYFTEAVARRVVSDQPDDDAEYFLEWDGRDILMTRELDGRRETDRIEPTRDGLYGIGGWLWTWEEIEDVEDVCREVVRG